MILQAIFNANALTESRLIDHEQPVVVAVLHHARIHDALVTLTDLLVSRGAPLAAVRAQDVVAQHVHVVTAVPQQLFDLQLGIFGGFGAVVGRFQITVAT